MTFTLLGHSLHETGERAKKYFSETYGAKSFVCEEPLEDDLPLKPTWQATTGAGYRICIDVGEKPFSPTLNEFVASCAQRGLPIYFWVAVPEKTDDTFSKELKRAAELGVGVVQFDDNGTAHEWHKPVPFSLFGLRRASLKEIPKNGREAIRTAEDAFMRGDPARGCQLICQDLESITRKFAQFTHSKKWWKNKPALAAKFFTHDAWATMLERLDQEIVLEKVKKKCAGFKKSLIAGARQYTDWRNSLSHKPKTLKELKARDTRLRTMFEATRDLLIEWFEIARVLKL